MATSFPSHGSPTRLLTLSAALKRSETPADAVGNTVELAEELFETPTVSVYEYDAASETVTTIGPSVRPPDQNGGTPSQVPVSVVDWFDNDDGKWSADGPPQATVVPDQRDPLQATALVPVGPDRLLRLGVADRAEFDSSDVTAVEGLAANLGATLDRIVDRPTEPRRTGDSAEDDATALRKLNEFTVDAEEFDATVERLLSLGCEYFGLDTGLLSQIDGDDYEVVAVVDSTETHETGTVYDLGETMCEEVFTGDVTEPLAFADVANSDFRDHPATETVGAYIAAPVVVDGETYGTVNFSMDRPRSDPFRSGEREFVKLVAQWIGTEIERGRQFEELERYETILEAVDDPVYALDTDGRFTFVNDAARREFGYGTEIIGNRPSVGMAKSDVERVQEQIAELLDTDDRSTTTEFELATAEGGTKFVENRLALIGDDEFRGTAGVLRDITDRRTRRRQLESFQRAVEEAADGIAILDDGTYTYVDQTHADLYGFGTADELLGNSWRKLYDETEVERLEREVFPKLETDGYWRGMVTGSRPDGSTFPAELSLTIVDDGRLVCTVRDETDRKRREKRKQATVEAFERVYEVTTDPNLSFEAKVDGLLSAANEYLDVPYGFLTRIDTDDDGTTGTQHIVEARGDHELLQAGESNPLPQSYCRKTVEEDGLVTITNAGETGWEGDPAYETFGLETYISGAVGVDGNTYGTLCFASSTPRERSFTETEKSFISLLRRWIGYEIDRKTNEQERRRNERRFQSLFEDPEMLVGLLDTDGTVLEVNETALSYIDTTLDDIRGDQFSETPWWSHSDDLQADLEEWINRAADGEYVEYDATHSDLDGDTRHVTGTIRPVTDESGSVESLVVSGRDVTERDRQRRELQDRQQKLDLVLSNTDTAVAELDLQTGSVEWDDNIGDNDIGSPETVESLVETIHPDDRERIQADMAEILQTGEGLNGEYRIRFETDEYGWIAAQAVPAGDGQDEESIVAIATDITDLKEREQALEESQDRYQTLLQAAPDPVFVADAETGEIVEVNAAAEEMFGRPRGEIIGRNQTELHPADDNDLYREAFEQSAGTSTMISELPDGSQPKLRGSDGEAVPVEINADTVQLPQGQVMYGVFRDISERRERERELELKERAMDEAAVGITISDPSQADNPLIYVNDGFVEQTGYSRADAVGQNRRFLHGDDSDQPALDDLRTAIAAEEAITADIRDYRKDGEQFWNRLSMTPVYDDGGTLRNYIGIQQDVTEEKRREQCLRALHETTRQLLGADDVDEAADMAVNTLAREFGFHLASVYVREETALVQAASTEKLSGDQVGRVERGRTPLWEAIEAGSPVYYNDCTDIEDGVDRGETEVSAYFPLGDHGVVVVGDTDDDGLDAGERRLVEMLASSLAAVLDTLEQQRELTKEREQFRLLTESVDEYAFLVVDDDGIVQTWNESAESTFGYDAETALGTSVAELHPADDRESGLPDRLLQQARVAGESAHEGWLVRADESEFYADARYAPLEAEDGEFRGYAMVVRDMTDRRRQQRRTERFVEESDDVVTILDTGGKITYTSGSTDRVLGYDPDELVGENLFDYLHPESREAAMEAFFSGIENPDASIQAECRIESADGEWLNVEGQCRNLLDDDAVDGILLYLRDVTEIKERARRFESIFNQTFQFTGLLGPDGTVLEVNDAALEFGGVDYDTIVGEQFVDAPWWGHSETVRDDVRSAVARAMDGEFVRYETEVRGADGLATIDFSVKPVTDEDGTVSLLVVEGRDITEQQQQRRHLDVMQRVMRHNMRNDLNKVRGWTQVLSEEDDAEKRVEQFETVSNILDGWEAMTQKMKQIRTTLQSQHGQHQDVEVSSLVEDAVAPVREADPDATILTDTSDIESVRVSQTLLDAVQELVENAVNVSNGATVEVELDRRENGWIEILVGDDGPGIPEMEAEVLETGEETPLNHGQGLGLWMVRVIVTQVGGDVSVESSDDGTTVCLRLPTDQRDDTGHAIEPAK